MNTTPQPSGAQATTEGGAIVVAGRPPETYTEAEAAGAGDGCEHAEYRPDGVCPGHAPWNQAEPEAGG